MVNIFLKLVKNKERFLSLLIYIVLFLFLLYPYRDYDWGWHFKQGEYLFTHGSLYLKDTYSFTMPGYQWVNHEWLYDPLVYVIFSTTSFLGLSIAGAIVAFFAFYFCVKGIKLLSYQLAICAFLFGYLTSGVVWQGLRSQMIGLLFIAFLMYLFRKIDQNNKTPVFFIPLFFLFWANMHGTFTFGLLIFGLYVIQKILIENIINGRLFIGKSQVYLLISFTCSVLLTFLNPFGIGVYFEALRHFHNPLLKYISEWNPVGFPSTFYALILLYIIILCAFVVTDYRKTKKVNIYMIGISIFTAFLAFGARRYVAILVTATLPFVAIFFSNLKLDLYKYKATYFLLFITIVIAFEIAIFNRVIPFRIFQGYSYNEYCSFGSSCSEKLTDYIIKNPPVGQGFNFYDWGGYLIGRGVQAKLFVDGRMHLWKDDKTGYSPFWDYQRIYYQDNLKLFDKYNFSWAIIPSKENLSLYIQYKKVKGTWVKKIDDGRAAYWVRTK
ncbi:MAG: hypothetical protein KBC00_01110 [Candidatus Levybacteria bacterium]|nr:hypothetical protein [Candidatus Levybacteria bacterium]MBP9814937.1 hypothetical protein [Candidatus Levybacteria bacterium]